MRYKSQYKSQIIVMITDGYTNKQIWEQTGCNIKYPAIIRRELAQMTEEERQREIESSRKELKKEEKKKAETKTTGMMTPTKLARGRFIHSGY